MKLNTQINKFVQQLYYLLVWVKLLEFVLSQKDLKRLKRKMQEQILLELKKKGIWVYGTAAEGATSLYEADLKGPAAIVIGSEGSGMGRLVREKCDFLVSIPMKGHISSLNASAAAAILLYEAVRRRM